MSDAETRRQRDRAEINDLLVRLALAQDGHDWNALSDCFEADAVYDHPGGQLVGVEPIVDRSRAALSPLDASQHLLGTILISLGDDRSASSTSYFQAQHVRRDAPGGELYTIAGTYRDRLSCRDGQWRVAHRIQSYTWRDGNPDVIVRRPGSARERP